MVQNQKNNGTGLAELERARGRVKDMSVGTTRPGTTAVILSGFFFRPVYSVTHADTSAFDVDAI